MNKFAKQILFVGPEVATHPRLRSDLTQLNPAWKAAFIGGGAEALSLLSESRFDAVVADDSLPDMDGFGFLNTVQKQFPELHRMIVCELADAKAALKTTRQAHHCVPKPWDRQTIQAVLERTFALSVWLSNSTVRALVQKMSLLPSPPTFYFEIVRALRSDHVDLEELGGKAAKDPALTAKLLQISNSAVLGLRHKVTRVQDAIGYLGLETTRSLVLLAHSFSYCDKIRTAGFSIERLWQHSLAVGGLARRIARAESARPETIDESFLAGLLHDIGKLLLAANMPDEYSQVIARVRQPTGSDGLPVSLWQAEFDQFGATHAEIGAELMATWNLPLTVVEALALHHRPAKLISPAFAPLAAVHVADAFAYDFSNPKDPLDQAEVDLTYLWDVGVAERLETWREACREEFQRAEQPGNS
jgi:putative nucleotidyltransferase with HDIG domain